MPELAIPELLRSIRPEEAELVRREAVRRTCEKSLYKFVKWMWPVIEPYRPFVEGWAIGAIAEHLQAVTEGQIRRLIINVPPGFSKSLCTSVFWPAWEWGPRAMPSMRYICASYSQDLTVRDNIRARNLVLSPLYQGYWGKGFKPADDQFTKVKFANDKTGWKLATSVGGIGTGERADRFMMDDPNSVQEAESEAITASTNQWALEVVPTRLNDPEKSAIILIQQRTNERDVTGTYLAKELGYDHLCIPMHYDSGRHCVTVTGWEDPRDEDGELAWPERFPEHVVDELAQVLGPYAAAGQLEQSPVPRGGGIIKRDWWALYEGPQDMEGKETYPICEFVLASLDTAYGEKEENDYSALTIWGLWYKDGVPKLLLLNAWKKRLPLNGTGDMKIRSNWGLVEWIAHSCKRFSVDKLIIENKARGVDVGNEIRRLYRESLFGVELVDPKGKDKVARTHAVVPMFTDGMVYAPDRTWAEEVIGEVCTFPRAAHDDLHDSVIYALSWFRRNNLAQLRAERTIEEEGLKKYKPKTGPLYPA